jgi:hypothetical protein
MTRHVRVIAVPAGEAPEWVRQKWVGVELPLALRDARDVRTFPVLSGPRGILDSLWRILTGRFTRRRGYMVEVAAAIAALERVHPDAAAWWRANAPHLFRSRRFFMFQQHECHVIEERPR